MFKMTTYNTYKITLQHFLFEGPPKYIYPNWDFWSENKTSGNPDTYYTTQVRCKGVPDLPGLDERHFTVPRAERQLAGVAGNGRVR
jgi:hypothetical protein